MRILVCGSREFADPFTVSLMIDERIRALPPNCDVIHGEAFGADTIAAASAIRHGHRVRGFPANWQEYGRRAGIVRNLTMLAEQPDLVLAFWNGKSRGTKHTIEAARERGIPTEVYIT